MRFYLDWGRGGGGELEKKLNVIPLPAKEKEKMEQLGEFLTLHCLYHHLKVCVAGEGQGSVEPVDEW